MTGRISMMLPRKSLDKIYFNFSFLKVIKWIIVIGFFWKIFMFDKAKMLAQAMKLKKAVEAETVEVEEGGIKVIASGDQKIKFLSINGVENKLLVDTVNKALKKSQEAAAKRMKDMGGLEGLF